MEPIHLPGVAASRRTRVVAVATTLGRAFMQTSCDETKGYVMGNLDGRVAFITGASRGQGRAHAVRLAADGADIIALDICKDIDSMDYPNASPEDLDETVKLVESRGRRIIAGQVDVRDADTVELFVSDGIREFGRLDIVIANAGIIRFSDGGDARQVFRDIIDVNLIGVWNTVSSAIPALIDGGRGGSIVITSSSAGLKGTGTDRAGGQAYTASKHALVGLMQVWANHLAQYSIRVNTIHPTGVATGMTVNDTTAQMSATDSWIAQMQNALPIDLLQPEDIAGAVAWLVSDEAKFITGTAWPLDAGFTIR
jgi:SDR family mycofactocin-dependent oxidoreductase